MEYSPRRKLTRNRLQGARRDKQQYDRYQMSFHFAICRALANEASRLRADGAPVPLASNPVERRLGGTL
jgi:hypothetical protein